MEDMKMASEAHRILQDKYEESRNQIKKLNEKLATQEKEHELKVLQYIYVDHLF